LRKKKNLKKFWGMSYPKCTLKVNTIFISLHVNAYIIARSTSTMHYLSREIVKWDPDNVGDINRLIS